MSLKRSVTALAKSIVTRLPGNDVLAHGLAPGPTILMYHRFTEREAGDGHTAHRAICEWQFSVLKRRATVWPLGDYFDAVRADCEIPKNLVVITVDDGYRDFYEVAFPLLRALQLPATFFPVVEFIDKQLWLWHDVLNWIIAEASPRSYSIDLAGRAVTVDLSIVGGRQVAWSTLCEVCLDLQPSERDSFLVEAAKVLDVDIPELLPKRFAPCSWAEIEEMSGSVVEIGAHTMTHPILSKLDAGRLDWEVAEPLRVLSERLGHGIRSFCYPNGQPNDVSDEVMLTVERAGYLGAVVTQRTIPDFGLFSTSRIGVSVNKREFLWKAHGWEQGIAWLRSKRQLATGNA